MSCRRSNSGYRQLYRSPGNRWSVDLVLWPRIDLVAVFALGRLTSAPRRWEDRQFGAGSLDVSGTCAPGRAALSREGPRVRIPPPPAASLVRTGLSASFMRPGPVPAVQFAPRVEPGLARRYYFAASIDLTTSRYTFSTRHSRNPAFCTLPTVSRLRAGPNWAARRSSRS